MARIPDTLGFFRSNNFTCLVFLRKIKDNWYYSYTNGFIRRWISFGLQDKDFDTSRRSLMYVNGVALQQPAVEFDFDLLGNKLTIENKEQFFRAKINNLENQNLELKRELQEYKKRLLDNKNDSRLDKEMEKRQEHAQRVRNAGYGSGGYDNYNLGGFYKPPYRPSQPQDF
ncbi:MAG: hypothetical protein ABIG69_11885 [Bacteroidota bacterium]